MLKYNQRYLHIIGAFIIIMLFGTAIMASIGLVKFVLFIPVVCLTVLHLIQRYSGIALDNYWKAAYRITYEKDAYYDTMHKQMVMLVFMSIIALVPSSQ